MAFFSWSKTAATNASADATVNWAEGQPPASVNDSARAMMARLAEYRDDTSGLLATAGTSTAYTLTTNQVLAATPTDGQLIVFSPHTGNGASATLAADGGNAFPIQTAPGTAVPAAALVSGTPYPAKFSSANSSWILLSFFSNPFNIPIGGALHYFGTTAPSASYALPAGQAISRTTYATLFSLISTTFGAGDGLTTFNLPDVRSRILTPLDNLNGSAANRITAAGGNFDGTVFGATGGAQNHTLTTPEMPAHTHAITDIAHSHTVPLVQGGGLGGGGAGVAAAGGNTATTSVFTGITGTNSAGSGSAHTILQPIMMVGLILRII